ncbi:MAG TPA: hypothetical protein VHY08_13740 [Bacillota bacterium]|nr:hypothetical protein [Bacillota bacterium]
MITSTISSTISELEEQVKLLPEAEREIFDRYFRLDTVIGNIVPPESMKEWIIKNFGELEKVENQKITKITNLLTLEGALFNELRASRPMECKTSRETREIIENSAGDPFCHPEESTPADTFGRVRGQRSITAGNIAKYDGYHSLVIFNEHDPLKVDEAALIDYFETGFAWARQALGQSPESKYYFFMWNCLWKSGASIIHGHAQVTLTRGMHYPKVESLRRTAADYQRRYGTCYFKDLHRIHERLGLAWEWEGVKGLAYLTPVKEKEILLWDSEPGVNLYRAVHRVLRKFEEMSVTSFNLVLYLPPLAPVPEDWSGFPALVRIVDRGDPGNKTADIGAMELYAASVISGDPFRVAEKIKE